MQIAYRGGIQFAYCGNRALIHPSENRSEAMGMWAAVTTALMLGLASSDPEVLRIGMMSSMSRGASPRLAEVFAPEFSKLVKDQTGLDSVILPGIDPFTAARQLESAKWHIGVFQGVELAWARTKYRDLQPLAIAVTRPANVRALLVAKKESTFKGFRDLRGKSLYLQTQLHCRLFADKGAGDRAYLFFGKLYQTHSGQDAMDETLRGKVDAAIVDSIAMESYKDINPGRYNHLKILAESAVFPAPAIVYRKSVLSDAMLQRLRGGLLNITRTEEGREAMVSFSLNRFQTPPADYDQTLIDIAKAYPPEEE